MTTQNIYNNLCGLYNLVRDISWMPCTGQAHILVSVKNTPHRSVGSGIRKKSHLLIYLLLIQQYKQLYMNVKNIYTFNLRIKTTAQNLSAGLRKNTNLATAGNGNTKTSQTALKILRGNSKHKYMYKCQALFS